MVHMTPGDLPGLPVEQLAQFLLGCAREDPTLLARSGVTSAGRDGRTARLQAIKPLRAVPLQLREPGPRPDPEMEELVSIALACARRAEDASRDAREVSLAARRRMSVVASLIGAGALAATVAIVLDRYHGATDALLADVASAVNGATAMQRQTAAQIAEVRSDMAALRDTSESGRPPASTVAQVPAVPRPVTVAPRDTAASDPPANPAYTDVTEQIRPDPPASRDTTAPGQALAPQVPALAIPREPGPVRSAAVLSPEISPRGAPAVTQAAVPVTTSEMQADPAPVSAPPAVTSPRSDATNKAAPPRPLPVAAHPRARYYPPRPPAWQQANAYRPPVQQVAATPTPQLVLSQVFEGVRRNIYAIFH